MTASRRLSSESEEGDGVSEEDEEADEVEEHDELGLFDGESSSQRGPSARGMGIGASATGVGVWTIET